MKALSGPCRQQLLGGPFFYVLVLLAVTLLCWRHSLAGIVVVALMCGGDGMADLIGRRFGGSLKLPHNKDKSWAGSMAMFLGEPARSLQSSDTLGHSSPAHLAFMGSSLAGGAGMAVGLIGYFTACGLTRCGMWEIVGPVSGIAAIAAVVESLPVSHWLDDNLTVPMVTACLSHILLGQKRQHI